MVPAAEDDSDFDFVALKHRFNGPYIANGGYTATSASNSLAQGHCDLVAFGKLFIANPDLVARFKADAELNSPDPDTFYGGTEKGYTDYPAMSQVD